MSEHGKVTVKAVSKRQINALALKRVSGRQDCATTGKVSLQNSGHPSSFLSLGVQLIN